VIGVESRDWRPIARLVPASHRVITLNILNSTRNRDTSKPRVYSKKVCKVLRWLQTVDQLHNPFGTITQAEQRPSAVRTLPPPLPPALLLLLLLWTMFRRKRGQARFQVAKYLQFIGCK